MKNEVSSAETETYPYGKGKQNKEELEYARLQIAQKEYDRQVADFAHTETKTSFLMILFVAIIPMLVQIIQELDKNKSTYIVNLILSIIIVALSTCGFVCITLSIISHKFNKIEAKSFITKDFAENDMSYFYACLSSTYIETVKENQNFYDFKHRCFKIACVVTVLAAVLSFLTLFLTYCI